MMTITALRRHSAASSGQAGVEMAVTIVFIVGALVAMALYIQRAYAGYLYGQVSTHGPQFDATQAYTDTRLLNNYTLVEQTDTLVVSPGLQIDKGFCGPNPDAQGCAPDVAGGVFEGNILQTKSKSTVNWDVSRNATFTAN